MTSSRSRFTRGVAAAALLLLSASCGGDDGSSEGGDAPVPSGTQTPAPIPTPSPGGDTLGFDGAVMEVDVSAGTFILVGGQIIDVNGVAFDPAGDFHSIEETASAVGSGSVVRAEGDGPVMNDTAVVNATSLKAEVDD